MDEKKYLRILRNPRFISGVHNYCDRWCERCPFTLRCSVYAVGEEMEKDRGPHDRKNEELWPRLESAAALAAELLEAHKDHPGVGVAKDPIFKSHDRPADSHRIGAAAKRYMEFSHRFVRQQQNILPNRPANPEVHAVSAAEAFDVICFYHLFIAVKLSRALSHHEIDDQIESDPELAGMPRDQDGSAKIALIAIDRSILAWAVLQLCEPAQRETALSSMLSLARLRTAVEKSFPKARTFVRPGFDTHVFPKRKK